MKTLYDHIQNGIVSKIEGIQWWRKTHFLFFPKISKTRVILTLCANLKNTNESGEVNNLTRKKKILSNLLL